MFADTSRSVARSEFVISSCSAEEDPGCHDFKRDLVILALTIHAGVQLK